MSKKETAQTLWWTEPEQNLGFIIKLGGSYTKLNIIQIFFVRT